MDREAVRVELGRERIREGEGVRVRERKRGRGEREGRRERRERGGEERGRWVCEFSLLFVSWSWLMHTVWSLRTSPPS